MKFLEIDLESKMMYHGWLGNQGMGLDIGDLKVIQEKCPIDW